MGMRIGEIMNKRTKQLLEEMILVFEDVPATSLGDAAASRLEAAKQALAGQEVGAKQLRIYIKEQFVQDVGAMPPVWANLFESYRIEDFPGSASIREKHHELYWLLEGEEKD